MEYGTILSSDVVCTNSPVIIMLQEFKKLKVVKQWRSPIPADTLVENLVPDLIQV